MYTVVPPYPLIQYLQFQLSMVHRGLNKNWKIKEINVLQVSKRPTSENGL
jgi:hypothetical protein